MLHVSLALMLALSLIYPQSVVVSFVAARAILATVICVVAGGVGVYATEYVLERYGRELPPESLVSEDCRVAVFTAGAVAQAGSGSGGDGGDVYLAGRRRVDFYCADLSCGVAVFPADTHGLPSASLRGGNHVKADDCTGRVVIAGGGGGLFLAKHENARLRTSLDRANNVASGQQTTITMLKNQLHVALTRADKNELAQVALRQELENAAKREAQREKNHHEVTQ